jgi:hypothetical protein
VKPELHLLPSATSINRNIFIDCSSSLSPDKLRNPDSSDICLRSRDSFFRLADEAEIQQPGITCLAASGMAGERRV